jgi:hypothetical protein
MTPQPPFNPDSPVITFRDTVWRAVPPWLKIGTAQRLLYSIAVQLDAAGDAIVAGVKMRFPNVYSSDSLPEIGSERRIRRGLTETSENYSARLRRWFEDHRRRGGAYALLKQLFFHYAPDNFPIALWYPSGTRYLMDVEGHITWTLPAAPSHIANWARWSLLYFTDDLGDVPLDDLVIVPRDWIAAHCFGEVIVMPTGTELWDYPPDRLWNNPRTWNTADSSFRVQVR